jgi:IMP dehydrogenase
MSLITFNDICIDSQYSEVTHRSNIDLTTNLGRQDINIKFPVISANMPDITEHKMAIEMFLNGGLGIIHRFMSIDENVNQFNLAMHGIKESAQNFNNYSVGVSVGVNDSEKERFTKLYEAGSRLFCIDIAHGHTIMMRNMIQWIKSQASDVVIIAGNIATKEAALDLIEWGATTLKVGIGPGLVCRTRSNTGVGKPQFSALQEIYEVTKNSTIKIISDGGIKTAGDVAKALIYADAVMVGAVLAGTTETPGFVYATEGTDLTNRTYYKSYGGSASAENKVKSGQVNRFVEGEMKRIPFKGHAKYLLREIKDGLQSSLSYTGAINLNEYKRKVKWYNISGAGRVESKL